MFTALDNKKRGTYICPQTPMGSWRVNASLVLLSTSMVCAKNRAGGECERWEESAERVLLSYLPNNLVCPAGVVPQALDRVHNIKVPKTHMAFPFKTPTHASPRRRLVLTGRTHLAILTGFPLFKLSNSASSCMSLSIKSASLFRSRARSKPVTFFPHVV